MSRTMISVACLFLMGCADQPIDLVGGVSVREPAAAVLVDNSSSLNNPNVKGEYSRFTGEQSGAEDSDTTAGEDKTTGGESVSGGSDTTDRKIIHTATLEIIAEKVATVDESIRELLKNHGGYIADYRQNRVYGDRLSAVWVLRVPAGKFNDLLAEIEELGERVENKEVSAEDVTEEYIDLQMRLANKKVLKDRIKKLIEEKAGNVKDVVEAESHLSRVTEEIERMTGRLRYLSSHVKMTTITLSAREKQNYVPASFSERITATFTNSISLIGNFFQGLAIFLVAAIPWVILAVIALQVLIYLWKLRRSWIKGVEH